MQDTKSISETCRGSNPTVRQSSFQHLFTIHPLTIWSYLNVIVVTVVIIAIIIIKSLNLKNKNCIHDDINSLQLNSTLNRQNGRISMVLAGSDFRFQLGTCLSLGRWESLLCARRKGTKEESGHAWLGIAKGGFRC